MQEVGLGASSRATATTTRRWLCIGGAFCCGCRCLGVSTASRVNGKEAATLRFILDEVTVHPSASFRLKFGIIVNCSTSTTEGMFKCPREV